MKNTSATSKSESAAMIQARAGLPIIVTPAIQVNAQQAQESQASCPSLLTKVPVETLSHILNQLATPHHCLHSPYDLHTCTMSYGPLLRAVDAISRTNKYLHFFANQFRLEASPHYRETGSKFETDIKRRLINPLNWTQLNQVEKMQLEYEFLHTLSTRCTNRYNFDPLPSASENIPQQAAVNIMITAGELTEMELDDGTLRKYWVPGKMHTLAMSGLDLETTNLEKAGRFISFDVQHLISLDLGEVPTEPGATALCQALKKCTNLKHLSLADCTQSLLETAWSLPQLVSLKLHHLQSVVPIGCWKSLTSQKDGLQGRLECLSLTENNNNYWQELLPALKTFGNLRELRLQMQNLRLKSKDLQALHAVISNLPLLKAIELPVVDESALGALADNLPMELSSLILSHKQTLSDASAAGLFKKLLLRDPLQSLSLHLRLKDESATALKTWLENPACALQRLQLRIEIQNTDVGPAIGKLVEGLCVNHSLRELEFEFFEERGSSDFSGDSDGLPGHPENQRVAHLLAVDLPKMKGLEAIRVKGNFSDLMSRELALAALDCSQLLKFHLRSPSWSAQSKESCIIKLESEKRKLIEFIDPHLRFPVSEFSPEERGAIEHDLQQRLRRQLIVNRGVLWPSPEETTTTLVSTSAGTTSTSTAATTATASTSNSSMLTSSDRAN